MFCCSIKILCAWIDFKIVATNCVHRFGPTIGVPLKLLLMLVDLKTKKDDNNEHQETSALFLGGMKKGFFLSIIWQREEIS